MGATRQSLFGPFTITLASPSTVAPTAPVLLESNSVFIGSGANIVSGTTVAMGAGGGGVHAEPDGLLNDVWSRGTADLRDRVNVRGTLHASNATLGNSVVIAARDNNPPFDPPQTLSWTVTYPPGTGTNITLNSGQSQTLAPGLYGSVLLNSQSTLQLSTGTYYFTDLVINSAVTVNLDQSRGPVILYVANTLNLRGAFVPLGGPADGGPFGGGVAGGSAHPNLLIGYLGTNQLTVESLFDGAIVAPFTTMILRAVNGIHTGFFAAKDFQILDAHAQVQYRAPLAIIPASGSSGLTCEQLLAATVPPSELAADIAKFCTTCASPEDTDHDGLPDCAEGCPYDANKTRPGMCGCGVPDTDSDGDGVPDCIDLCPLDPSNTSPGECGCAGQSNVKPAGTPCTDSACPQSGATCNGAGVCGNRAACMPGPGCRFVNFNFTQYWICGEAFPVSGKAGDGGALDGGAATGQATRNGAQLACAGKGLTLTRIHSLDENRLVDLFLSTPMWLGANDISLAGTWRWATPTSNDGDPFWSGGPTGSPVNSLFSNWAATAPGSQVCSALLPFDGRWVDVGCNESLGYACSYQTPFGVLPDGGPVPQEQPPGMLDPAPDGGPCIPEQDSGLPDSIAALQNQILAARDGSAFTGAAASPPPDGSTCSNDPLANAIGLQADSGIGCSFDNVDPNSHCIQDSDCPAGFQCREIKLDAGCEPPDAQSGNITSGLSCPGAARCGHVNCRVDRRPCDQINICNGSTVDSGLDDGSTLTPHAFDPATLFEGGIPDSGPSVGYVDPPGPPDSGVNHPWCTMKPQDPTSVKNASVPSGQLHGRSGGATSIHFNFDPDLVFDVQANPLALGETQLHLHAKGALHASFALRNFLGEDFDGDILNASIGILADRCSLNDVDDTKFQVFGLDLINPFDFGIPKVNTTDSTLDANLASLTSKCEGAVDGFILAADRAKKAFRDAEQLLEQYYSALANGKNLGQLCNSIGVFAATVPAFPGGNICYTDETPEWTINRFIDYYQLPGSSQVHLLDQAAGALGDITSALAGGLEATNINIPFGQPDKEESQTILFAQFAIGPVPMVLEIDVFADYGVPGKLQVDFKFPISLGGNQLGQQNEVAGVKSEVVPHASAGLDAFVGAGFNLGALSVELGIEGAVTLADIKLPIFAGAELDEVVTQDLRPLPANLLPPVTSASGLTQFGIPTAFQFLVKYDYGMRLDITDILGGALNAKLHIDFFFFSRTWRKQIVKFNGFELHLDIIKDGSNPAVGDNPNTIGDPTDPRSGMVKTASGAAPMGRAENQVPLMMLDYVPESDGGTDASVGFDAANVQSVFYDDLCCSKQDGVCSDTLTPRCCPGFTCVHGAVLSTCQKNQCADFGGHCAQNSDCCSNNCGPFGVCTNACAAQGASCTVTGDCCPGFQCGTSGTCVPNNCIPSGSPCTQSSDCCSGLTCLSNHACGQINQ
ncbi:MAG: hypothetical protein JOZ69_00740 [Myxococcales bacterium]|nr:hypothetical protein [Myxococcales bacterium]